MKTDSWVTPNTTKSKSFRYCFAPIEDTVPGHLQSRFNSHWSNKSPQGDLTLGTSYVNTAAYTNTLNCFSSREQQQSSYCEKRAKHD